MWKSLKPGDIVDVIAPGWAPPEDIVIKSIDYIKSWGLTPRFDEQQLDPKQTPLACHSDEVRFKYFKKAINAKDSKFIWCLRGGYGAIRLMPQILKLKKPAQQKMFLGYSDVTTLHVFLTQKWGWKTIHGPLLDAMPKDRLDEESKSEVKEIIFAQKKALVHENLQPLNLSAEKSKSIKAPLIGGNLIVLQSTLGTPYSLKTKNKILFLEETGERGYRVDRALQQLEQAGSLNQCKAVLFGSFIGGEEATSSSNYVQNAIHEFSQRTKIPCFHNLQVGHGTHNRPIPCGVQAEIKGFDLTIDLKKVFA